ncbi:Fc.00g049120.m01.CDS01 [Cosmosporella sp. VM-42]
MPLIPSLEEPGSISYNASHLTFGDHARLRLGNDYHYSSPNETEEQINKKCLASLRSTDPRDDKIRIEKSKGGLLKDPYRWVLQCPEFLRWRNDDQCRLLWIKGDPGKGKTMLLCGIINELGSNTKLEDPTKDSLLSYFFCQAANTSLSTATAPLLLSYIREKQHDFGKIDPDHWNYQVIISDILSKMVKDPVLRNSYLIIDALDECEKDRTFLLDFILSNSNLKWIVSSRNRPEIQEYIEPTSRNIVLSLELNEKSVSVAVSTYIQEKVNLLAKQKKCTSDEKAEIQSYLSSHANGTFLWVALVFQKLQDYRRYELMKNLKLFPKGLNNLYEQQMTQLCESRSSDIYKQIFAIASTVFRPVSVKELMSLETMLDNESDIPDIIRDCGSFLTLRDEIIYFVHQSGKDFLLATTTGNLFPSGIAPWHYTLFEKSLEAMVILKKDICGMIHPGAKLDEVDPELHDLDSLARIAYLCVYWVDHLYEATRLADGAHSDYANILGDDGEVYEFLGEKFLFWIEALCLCRKLSPGALALSRLSQLLTEQSPMEVVSGHLAFVRDAYRFVCYFRPCIEDYPLQVYASGLLFSPTQSLIRQRFQDYGPKWIAVKPEGESQWSACLEVLECEREAQSLAFTTSHLAMLDDKNTLMLWDTNDYTLQRTASWSEHRIWVEDVQSHVVKWTIEVDQVGFLEELEELEFSPDGKWLACSFVLQLQLWNVKTGKLHHIHYLDAETRESSGFAFSHDSRLVAVCEDIYDPINLQAFDVETAGKRENYKYAGIKALGVRTLKFLPNNHQLAVCGRDGKVWTWDMYQQSNNESCFHSKISMQSWGSSSDGKWLAVSNDGTVEIYDIRTCERLLALQVSSGDYVGPIAFSPNGQQLAVACGTTVWLWDVLTALQQNASDQSQGSHDIESVVALTYFDEGPFHWLATLSKDGKVQVWNADTGTLWRTFQTQAPGLHSWKHEPVLASGPKLLALASADANIQVWDPIVGVLRHEFHPSNAASRAGSISVAISHNGLLIVAVCGFHWMCVWNADTGKLVKELKLPPEHYTLRQAALPSMAFSSRDKWFAVAWSPDLVRLWNTEDNWREWAMPGKPEAMGGRNISLSFSPNQRQLAVAFEDGVRLWGVMTKSPRYGRIYLGGESHISYTDDSTMVTDRGSVNLEDLKLTTSEVPTLLGCGCDDSWITWNGREALWLPAEYRPNTKYSWYTRVVATNLVAIGCSSGRVSIIRFSLDAGDYFNG